LGPSKIAASSSIKTCLDTLKMQDPARLRNVLILFSPGDGCLNGTQSCFGYDTADIGVVGSAIFIELLAIREAHPTLKTIFDAANAGAESWSAKARAEEAAVAASKADPKRDAKAAAKGDIRGFSPGMTSDEVVQHSRDIGCLAPGGSPNQYPITSCIVSSQESFNFQYTNYTSEPLLKGVALQFVSGTPFASLAQQVSNQFQSSAQMGHIGSSGWAKADWQLADRLFLTLATEMGGSYSLTLKSTTLDIVDQEAKQERQRSINPRPKF
jgi:hypothetical protein